MEGTSPQQGSSSIVHDHFQAWCEVGMFPYLWQAGAIVCDATVGVAWEGYVLDGAMTKLPLRAEPVTNRTGRDKCGIKYWALTESHGALIGLYVGGANRHDVKLRDEILKSVVIEQPEPVPEHP